MLVNLSKQFGLLCSLTTFVAVEHRSIEERNEGRPALRRVPVQMAQGWGAVYADLGVAGGGPAAAVPMAAGGVRMTLSSPAQAPGKPKASGMVARFRSLSRDLPAAQSRTAWLGDYDAEPSKTKRPSKRAASPSADDLQELLALQSADGWFGPHERVTELLARFVGGADRRRDAVVAALPLDINSASGEKAIDTALALITLPERFADREAIWRRAYRKACRHFLAPALGMSPEGVEQWLAGLRQAAAKA
jgi:hypothetical protein